MRSLRAAIVFLTRIPVGVGRAGPPQLSRTVPWFPIVGAAIGALVGLAYLALAQVLPATLSAAVAVSFGVAVTGAFHIDGLADCADAFAGGATVERRLEILKDSTLGTYGTSALALVLLVEIAALAALDPTTGLKSLVSAYAIGRGASVCVMVFSRKAVREGLGADYITELNGFRCAVGVFAAIFLVIALNGTQAAVLFVFALPPTVLMWAWSHRSIGGVVGDSLGAITQLSQTSVLLGAVTLNSGVCACSW